jgi:argininosuccinate lyase
MAGKPPAAKGRGDMRTLLSPVTKERAIWSSMSVARGGRLPDAVDQAMHELNTSVAIDSELWREDIQGSIAHARGLENAGVLSAEEADQIVQGLESIAREIEDGRFSWDPAKEDVHMNIEARLTQLCGAVGGKLHTGRSRNDQVATDLRLWTRRKSREALTAIAALARVLLDRAEAELDTLMPAYTHLQRAQPSRLSHHLMAWQELLWRDHGRLRDALVRLDESPLGAGAVAGTGFAIDRARVAERLGFAQAMRNSIDATASRDFLMEVTGALAILGVHLSRIGEEIVIWSSQEFGFMRLHDAFTTSSSMMPQKKNPDVAELVRGKCARTIGSAISLLVLEKSLCFGYGRDLQEDKRPLFDAFESALVSLRALGGAIATASFDRQRLRAALAGGHLCATDVADLLVKHGLPFREAHHLVGGLVREAEQRGVDLGELPREVLGAAHPALAGEEARQALDPAAAVERRGGIGGPARARVAEAIADARERWAAL